MLRNNKYRRLDLFLLSTMSTVMQSSYLLHLIMIITVGCKNKYKYINGERWVYERVCVCVCVASMLKTGMTIVGKNRYGLWPHVIKESTAGGWGGNHLKMIKMISASNERYVII